MVQITGGPLASIMSLENPEAFDPQHKLKGKKQSILTDSNFEIMTNPEKFCISGIIIEWWHGTCPLTPAFIK